jgi:hypothetical protein
MARRPITPCVFKIFLSIDLDVAPRRIDVGGSSAGLDHVLQEVNEIRLLEQLGFSPGAAGELAAAAVVVLA